MLSMKHEYRTHTNFPYWGRREKTASASAQFIIITKWQRQANLLRKRCVLSSQFWTSEVKVTISAQL